MQLSAASGVLLAVVSWLFLKDWLSLYMQAVSWSIIFFVASSAASSAYLTVSEIFPLEIRALAIAIFYACGTLVGGVGALSSVRRLLTQTSGHARCCFGGYMRGSGAHGGGGFHRVDARDRG